MNLKKILLSVMVIMVFILAQSNVYAATLQQGQEIYMGITELMMNDKSNMGYAIGDPDTNTINTNAAKIWNIIKYKSSTSKEYEDGNIYCIKAGVGFTQTNDGTLERRPYDVFYDMKTERENIKNHKNKQGEQNQILKDLVEGTITENGKTINRYDAILAVLDRMYLPGESTLDDKKELIYNLIYYSAYVEGNGGKADDMSNAFDYQSAGLKKDEFIANLNSHKATEFELTQYALTDNDINAVQQAVLWYFTNYGEENGKYDKTNKSSWLKYTLDGTTYATLKDDYAVRNTQAEVLYNYMIKQAKENANNYTNSSSDTGLPVEINTTKLNYKESGDNYIVGPIHMTENNATPYTIDFVVKNNGTEIKANEYDLLDKEQKNVAKGTTIQSLIGEDFYISIPKNKAEALTINITINYKNTNMKLWTSSTNNQEQPLVEVHKEPKTSYKELTLNSEKIFDLALRKYITKVNDVELKGSNSRVPNINESALTSGTTATYKHKKDPVTIETGNKVTYKMTIYNEGEKAGRATKVVDQLPTGLEFTRIVSGNFELGSYDTTNNTLTLVRKANNTENLPAYTSGNLAEETIEIECTVTAKPDTKNATILTNVAWISEEYNAEDKITITNQKNADRDSEPDTVPSVNKDNMSDYKGNDNKSDLTDSNHYYKGQQDDDDFEKLVLLPPFDLKLIKRITAVNGQNQPERIESIDASKLNTLDNDGNMITTAEYKLNKEPVAVKKGDIVTYTFRIYNEGTIDGYAQQITEDIPEGLEFLWSEKEGEELAADTTLTEEEKAAIEFNQTKYWTYADNTLKTIKTDYLSRQREPIEGDGTNLIKAFGSNDGTKTDKDLSYKEVSVMLKVVADNATGTIIRNEACISEDSDKDGNTVDDRDSDTEDWKKYEDDEDYDNIILKSFDLALRKFIIAVSDDTEIEDDEYLKNTDGSYKRAPVVDTSKLNTKDENGNLITTAIYNHTKEPVEVKKNDIVIYMLRVYNEGEIDGYAAEIKDHLPSYLEFVNGDFNTQYGWSVSEDGRTVTTTYLKDSLIKAAEKITKAGATYDDDGNMVAAGGALSTEYKLSYKEVPIMCKVKDTAKADEKITNIADITKYLDENEKPVIDRDSEENNVEVPTDEKLPEYKDDETGDYIPGQEDDDDFEKLIIKRFDLALRKQITSIYHTYTEKEKEYNDRYAKLDADKKETNTIYDYYDVESNIPIVVENDVVTYSIRVYNEGKIDGTATWVTDILPSGLEYLPENEINTKYGWKAFKETTQENDKAIKIGEKYYEEVSFDSKEITLYATDYLKDTTIKAYTGEGEASYGEVFMATRVKAKNEVAEVAEGTEYKLRNIAEIGDDNGDDDDSTPGDGSEWKDQDDVDIEDLELVEFDLALRKWVTQAIVIENGQQTVTNTGHDAWDDPEAVVKVELHRKKLNQVTVKFRYSIRVYNQGDIAGYAKEITDYVPEGLKFVAEDNPGWTDEGNNVISTRLLENTLLQPGEYADVEVLLTWINNENNMGVMTNIAEISEDDNEYGVPDRDSTPDNKKTGEDDIDDAPVMLSVSTGQMRIYFTLGFIVLVTIAGGVVLIKKYVL